GYDIQPRQAKNFTVVKALNSIEPDVFVVCVPTKQVETACKAVASTGKLVLIESTMQIGTSRKIGESLNVKLLAHCPHRYWKLSPILHGVKQVRVLGAINSESLELAKKFYSTAEIPVCLVSSVEVAEASKLVENAWRFVNIAFVEEAKMLCEKLGLNFKEVRRACNTKWNTCLLAARDGIGGVCLPRDIRLLTQLYQEDGLMKAAVDTDKKYKMKYSQ
ncbi:unnamed protein product, partial [marine sediment metagenome]